MSKKQAAPTHSQQLSSCMYSAQGVILCKTRPLVEGFNSPNLSTCSTSINGFIPCQSDMDCRDPTMSCRIMPISKNATVQVCMPDNIQFATQVVVPYN